MPMSETDIKYVKATLNPTNETDPVGGALTDTEVVQTQVAEIVKTHASAILSGEDKTYFHKGGVKNGHASSEFQSGKIWGKNLVYPNVPATRTAMVGVRTDSASDDGKKIRVIAQKSDGSWLNETIDISRVGQPDVWTSVYVASIRRALIETAAGAVTTLVGNGRVEASIQNFASFYCEEVIVASGDTYNLSWQSRSTTDTPPGDANQQVWNEAGTTQYTLTTDYTIQNFGREINRVPGGAIPAGVNLLMKYYTERRDVAWIEPTKDGATGEIELACATSKNDTEQTVNVRTAPSAVTAFLAANTERLARSFAATLVASDKQGVWYKETLLDGTPAYAQVRISQKVKGAST